MSTTCTYECLHKWYVCVFEKCGWMIIAIDHKKKMKHYVEHIMELMESIDLKILDTVDDDRRTDLQIMRNNLSKLLRHCSKYLVNNGTNLTY